MHIAIEPPDQPAVMQRIFQLDAYQDAPHPAAIGCGAPTSYADRRSYGDYPGDRQRVFMQKDLSVGEGAA